MKWKYKRRNRFWRRFFKRKLKQMKWVLFEAQINEKRLEEAKQKSLEMQFKSGVGPFL